MLLLVVVGLMTPRAAITKHLLDGDDSWLSGEFDGPVKPKSATPPAVDGPTGGPAPFDADAT
jgi:sec-independent protein translocase protein TatB